MVRPSLFSAGLWLAALTVFHPAVKATKIGHRPPN